MILKHFYYSINKSFHILYYKHLIIYLKNELFSLFYVYIKFKWK